LIECSSISAIAAAGLIGVAVVLAASSGLRHRVSGKIASVFAGSSVVRTVHLITAIDFSSVIAVLYNARMALLSEPLLDDPIYSCQTPVTFNARTLERFL